MTPDVPPVWEVEIGELWPMSVKVKLWDLIWKKNLELKMLGCVNQVAEHLSGKCKALSLNIRTAKKKKKRWWIRTLSGFLCPLNSLSQKYYEKKFTY
jgi:hypothetical protein